MIAKKKVSKQQNYNTIETKDANSDIARSSGRDGKKSAPRAANIQLYEMVSVWHTVLSKNKWIFAPFHRKGERERASGANLMEYMYMQRKSHS